MATKTLQEKTFGAIQQIAADALKLDPTDIDGMKAAATNISAVSEHFRVHAESQTRAHQMIDKIGRDCGFLKDPPAT